MKCKYCGKHVRSIAHFMQAHKKLMLSKMRRARGKAKRGGSKRSRSASKSSTTKPTAGYKYVTLTLHD